MRKILAIIIALTTFVSTVHINSYAAGDTDAKQMEERGVVSDVMPQDDRPDSMQSNLGDLTSSQAHRAADPQRMEAEDPRSNMSDIFSDKVAAYVFGDDRVEREKSKADKNVHDKETDSSSNVRGLSADVILPEKSNNPDDSDVPDDADPKPANRKKSDKENEMDDDNASDDIHLFSDDSEPDDTEPEPGNKEKPDKESKMDDDEDFDDIHLFSEDSDAPDDTDPKPANRKKSDKENEMDDDNASDDIHLFSDDAEPDDTEPEPVNRKKSDTNDETDNDSDSDWLDDIRLLESLANLTDASKSNQVGQITSKSLPNKSEGNKRTYDDEFRDFEKTDDDEFFDFDIDNFLHNVDEPQSKRARVDQSQPPKKAEKKYISKEYQPNCIRVYPASSEPIDQSKINDDGAHSIENIAEIRKQLPGRTIIAVCPSNLCISTIRTLSTYTSFKYALKDKFVETLTTYKDENPIIYFGKYVYFDSDSFTTKSLGMSKIKADVIICETKFTSLSFFENTIEGMCILFHPDMKVPCCFTQNATSKGLFVVGKGPDRDSKSNNFPVSQSENACYISGDNLMSATYKIQLSPNLQTDFPGILTFSIQISNEFETPRVAIYNSVTYKYNSYDQKNLEVIKDKMKGRTIISVCSPCKLDFSYVKTDLMEKYRTYISPDPNKKPIIYFGQNIHFSIDSFQNQTIDADIIICGTTFGARSFYNNSIKGMCILFNPRIENQQSFFQNTTDKGLFLVGNGPDRIPKIRKFPICQLQNVCYLFGENLSNVSYKMPPPANVSNDFSDILSYVIQKAKEFDTPRVAVYDHDTYIYNAYDQENLKIIKKQLPDRTIIAVCSPCKLDLSYINKELFDLYKKPGFKNPIIYFGNNICFSLDSFKGQVMNADIIICGSTFSSNSFHSNTINGMCVLLNPIMNSKRCWDKNEIKKGLFVVGSWTSNDSGQLTFPICQTQNVCYLFGINLINESYKIPLPRNLKTDFSSILSYTIQKAKEFETPRIAEYNPTKYIYNQYDQEKLKIIRTQMPGKIIIAVCSPCKIDFSPTSKKPFDLCTQLSVLYKKTESKKPIIYFGQNVYFSAESFTKKTLNITEINADIIICGSKLVAKAFYDNTIKGMCMLFNPVTETKLCFHRNKIYNGLFIAGNSEQNKAPICTSCYKYTWYLFGEGLINRAKLRPETISTSKFSSALSFSLSKARKISGVIQTTSTSIQDIEDESIDDSISHDLTSDEEPQDMIDEEDRSTESKISDMTDDHAISSTHTDASHPNRMDRLADEIERLLSNPNSEDLKVILSKHNVLRDNILDKEALKAKLTDKSIDPAELALCVLPLQMSSDFTNEKVFEDTRIAHTRQMDSDLLSTDFCEDSSMDYFGYPKKKKSRLIQEQLSEAKQRTSLYRKDDPSCVQIYLDTDTIDESTIIDDGENSKENIKEIRKQMPDRIIIAVCPTNPNTSFKDAIKKTFIAKLEAYKDKNPIIYFGKNVFFNKDSFAPTSSVLKITADIIIYRSSICHVSLHENKINGMCVIFEPKTGTKLCFYNNSISKGLFVVGDGPIRDVDKSSYPICKTQNACYLSGENLMEKSYKIQLPSSYSTNFSDILAYTIQKSKELETPHVEKYDPTRYIYIDYDKNNLSTIAKKMPDRTLIAVCSPCKLDFSDILPDFVSKYKSYTNPIIYFGQNIFFKLNSFANQTINADIIICGSKFYDKSFHSNTIEGMCVLFSPVMNSATCFIKNTTSKGLFIVGNGRSSTDKPQHYSITQSENVCYLFGQGLIDPFYKIPLSFDVTTDMPELAEILNDVVKKAKEFETPRVEKYDPTKYTYNNYDQENLSTIAEKMHGRTIIAVCSPCKLYFSDIQTDFIEKYNAYPSSDPDKKTIIYFGLNILFKANSFINQTINADIIICGSKLIANSFKGNTVTGMCILFNPKMLIRQFCFSQNTVHKGLFVVGNALSGNNKHLANPITQKQNACYLFGSKLMSDAYKPLLSDPSKDFQKLSDILSDDVLKPKEFDTPCVSIYDPKTYTYNDYDQKNLSIIAEKMPGRTIIAVCSPCKLDFSDIQTDFISKYESHTSPIIYFGYNVWFCKNSFKEQTIDADIITCGSKFTPISFHNNTITGMCILFNPAMNKAQCFLQNTISKGLFVVGDGPPKTRKKHLYPIALLKNQISYYLSGKGLMDAPKIISVENDFAKILDFAISTSTANPFLPHI